MNLPLSIGLGIIIASHVWLLNDALPPSIKNYHAIGNLAAAGLIVYGTKGLCMSLQA